MLPDHRGAAAFHEFEQLRRLPRDIAREWRLHLLGVLAHGREQPVQPFGKFPTAGHRLGEVRLHARKFVGQHGLEQRRLAREMRVERLLAHAELGGKVVHRHAPKPLQEKMAPCTSKNARSLIVTIHRIYGNLFSFSSFHPSSGLGNSEF